MRHDRELLTVSCCHVYHWRDLIVGARTVVVALTMDGLTSFESSHPTKPSRRTSSQILESDCHFSCFYGSTVTVVDYLNIIHRQKSFFAADPNEVSTFLFSNPKGQSGLC